MIQSREKNFTLITGASAGLGKALAEECAQLQMNLILVALPGENLHKFGDKLQKAHEVEIHCYETDLTIADEPHKLAEWVKANFSVNMLINNAGIGGSILLEKVKHTDVDKIIMLNIRALCMLTYHFIPELKKQPKAYILNVSSLAAFNAVPYKTIYPASKAFVLSFSQSLRLELRGTPIKVAVLAPGAISTNHNINHNVEKHGWLAKSTVLSPQYTARKALRGLLHGKDLIIPGMANKLTYWLMKLLPDTLSSTIICHIIRKDVAPDMEKAPVHDLEHEQPESTATDKRIYFQRTSP